MTKPNFTTFCRSQINTVFLVLAVAALLRSKKQNPKALDKKKSIEEAA